MGSSQSSPNEGNAAQDALIEGLQELRLRENIRQQENETGYVEVDIVPPPRSWISQTLSPAAAEEWEKQLLADPKVSYPT